MSTKNYGKKTNERKSNLNSNLKVFYNFVFIQLKFLLFTIIEILIVSIITELIKT